jgi:hypothetical protein
VAARRLLIVMLVLLGISVLGGTLLPSQRSEERTGTTETTEAPTETTARDEVPQGRLLTQELRVSPDRVYKIEIAVGDQLQLTVRSSKPDQVEIPRLGLVDTVDRFAPARFDVLATEPGSYPIRLIETDRTIGRIAVTSDEA